MATANHIVGPVTQTNDPNVNPVGTNEIDVVTDDNMLNDCTESGNGDNNAACNNVGIDSIAEITQDNFVDASNTIGAGFVESNTINTLQGFDTSNDCDEAGDGNNVASCSNDVQNLIGPVDQSNSVTGSTPNTIHSNNIEVSQIGSVSNDCDESGAGAGINDAECSQGGDPNVNEITGVDQINEVTGADNAAQTNDFSINQAFDAENACNEFEDGSNAVLCTIGSLDNTVGESVQVFQFNTASGSPDANIIQNNEIDGDDALGLPGITQIIVAANTCGQTGSGDNLASCDIFGTDNHIDSLRQSNFADADDGDYYNTGQ